MHSPKALKTRPATAFEIQCGGCTLPAHWLPQGFVPSMLPAEVKVLVVDGTKTPTRTVKYLPALGGARWAQKNSLTGPGRRAFFPSSGNALFSFVDVVRQEKVELEPIGVVSSRISSGKRVLLEGTGIELITEIDLAKALGLSKPGDTFEMLDEYSNMTGIPIIDQYNCPADHNWNAESYIPIPEQVQQHVGDVSLFLSTAGSKGKQQVGVELLKNNPNMGLYVVYPLQPDYPNPPVTFPGGRGKGDIHKVRNKFVVEPTEVFVDEDDALRQAAQAGLVGLCGGITFGAELAAAQDVLVKLHLAGRLRQMCRSDGSIIVLLVISDTIFLYKEEMMRKYPRQYEEIEALWK